MDKRLAELKSKVSYSKIENFPDPLTGTRLNELSAKDSARIIFALSYKLQTAENALKYFLNQLVLQNCPVLDQ